MASIGGHCPLTNNNMIGYDNQYKQTHIYTASGPHHFILLFDLYSTVDFNLLLSFHLLYHVTYLNNVISFILCSIK